MSNLTNIFKNMTTEFPINECIVKDEKEKGIYYGKDEYLCLIIDKRFKKEATLKIMKPYVWIGKESGQKGLEDDTGNAWIDSSGNYIDHYFNPVHGSCDDWFVIGFTKYEGSQDEDLWVMLENELSKYE